MGRSGRENRGPRRWSGAATLAVALVAAGASSPPRPELRIATAGKLLEEIRRPGAQVVVVNVWATWCLPCREEFPDLVRLHRAYVSRGLRLVLVSADFDDGREEQVRRFLTVQGVDFPSFLKEGDDMEFIEALSPRWTGALPATLVYDSQGALRHFWEGAASYSNMEKNVLDVLERKSSPKEEGS